MLAPRTAPLVARSLRNLRHATKRAQRRVARLFRRHASGDIALDQSIKMRAQLLIYLGLILLSAKQPDEADEHGAKCFQDFHSAIANRHSAISPHHSARNATIGSTFAARRAGSQHANSAITSISTAVPIRVSTSAADTPKS